MKRNYCKIFQLSVKRTVSDSDTDEAFISIHQSIMTKIKKYASKDWIVLHVIMEYSIKIFAY